jgi:hypothetical protein
VNPSFGLYFAERGCPTAVPGLKIHQMSPMKYGRKKTASNNHTVSRFHRTGNILYVGKDLKMKRN